MILSKTIRNYLALDIIFSTHALLKERLRNNECQYNSREIFGSIKYV